MFKKVLTLTALVAGVGVLSLISSHSVGASHGYPQTDVTLCHSTNSATNPYDKITVNVNGGNSGHNQHTGPIAYSQAVANQLKSNHISWGDIIPPTILSPNGLNWTAIGQAVYNNDCAFPHTATAQISITPATCSVGEKLVYGSISHATFSGTANGTYGPANYSVTATAMNDSLFFVNQSAQTSIVFTGTLAGHLTGDKCDIPATVKPVTFKDPTCDANGSYTIPQSTGVDYQINNTVVSAGTYPVAAGTTVDVIAVAQKGYKIDDDDQTTEWMYTFTTPEGCTQVPNKPDNIVTTNTSSSTNCSTKQVTTIITTSTTTYTLVDNEWVANDPVVTSESSSRAATTQELSICASDDNGVVLGASTDGPVAQLPYTAGDTTTASVIVFSTIAAVVTLASIITRRILSPRV